jgi:UDP-2-acetamido-2-deoxy-ribo-hexuluronate aminotransferase
MPVHPTISMVDLKGLHRRLSAEIDDAMAEVIAHTTFIKGPQVARFATNLGTYLGDCHVVPCANGTDALSLIFMALDLQQGDEVILPAFTFGAAAEAAAMLGLVPVLVDIDPHSFNINPEAAKAAIGPRTKAIVAVHLFGQCAQLEPLLAIAQENGLYLIEDNAQAIGADYIFNNGTRQKAGTIGHMASASFFPSKNLGCYGDGGAVLTTDPALAQKVQLLANHGWKKKYFHEQIGINSRLDSLQAAVLDVKLKYLDDCNMRRKRAANRYDALLDDCAGIQLPKRFGYSEHIFHQYTIRVKEDRRDELKQYLKDHEIPSEVYYPVALQDLEVFRDLQPSTVHAPHAQLAADEVLSLPMHTELTEEALQRIADQMRRFFA